MSDLFLLKNTEIIDLFEIKINDFEGYLRFHGSKNFNKDLIFKGIVYLYIPSELSNLEYSSEGKQNRPTLSISNVNNFISNFIKDRNDLLGCRFFRKKILAKDLDDENFGGTNKNNLGSSSFISFISNDTFIIQKKNLEQKDKVDFLLANVLDVDGLVVPARKIFNDTCQWQYRGCGCNYGKINNYNGPSVPINAFSYTTLQQVHDDAQLDLKNYFVSWFQGDVATTNGISTLAINTNPQTNKDFPKVTAWSDSTVNSFTVNIQTGNSQITVTTVNSGRLFIGYVVSGAGIPSGATITALGTGTGGTGTYTLSAACIATNSITMTATTKITLTGQPKQFTNTRDKKGVLFDFTDTMTINLNFGAAGINSDCTVFYVSVMKNIRKLKEAFKRRGLTGVTPNFLLGYWKTTEDAFFIGEWANYTGSPTSLTDRVYVGVMPKLNTNKTIFYRDGNKITEQTGFTGSIKDFGINLTNNETSEIIVYEIIIYNKILTEREIQAVSTYLSFKYNTPISKKSVTTKYKDSVEYFGSTLDGNLGVPIADENNKLFLQPVGDNNELTNFENYGLTDLSYKGDYDNTTQYNKGDFVKIDSSLNFDFNEKVIFNNLEIPSKFFVCVIDNVKGSHPLYNTVAWREDKCSKNLNGCLLRFGGSKETVNIPFGAFPGTVGYDYRLPS